MCGPASNEWQMLNFIEMNEILANQFLMHIDLMYVLSSSTFIVERKSHTVLTSFPVTEYFALVCISVPLKFIVTLTTCSSNGKLLGLGTSNTSLPIFCTVFSLSLSLIYWSPKVSCKVDILMLHWEGKGQLFLLCQF